MKFSVGLILTLGSSALSCGSDQGGAESPDAAIADASPVADSALAAPDARVVPANVLAVLAGTLEPVDMVSDAGGRATLVRTDGGTLVSIHANGLQESSSYPVHVHRWPCAADEGGGHYKVDPSVGIAQESNEIWLSLDTGASSTIYNAWRSTSHQARRDALSIVVHQPGGDKFLCADLTPSDTSGTDVATGSVTPFAEAGAGDMSVAGTAELARNFETGEVGWSVDLSGLDPAATYEARMHTLPCDVEDAGETYKIDPSEASSSGQENELWLVDIVPDGSGNAVVSDSYTDEDAMAREDAVSMVVQRVTGDLRSSIACADLPRAGYPDHRSSGEFVPFTGSATGSGSLTRSNGGDTHAELAMSGLDAETDYVAHVHRLPCAIGMGGGHYKVAHAEDDGIETNEIWLHFTTDGAGEGSASKTLADHVAHAHAQSIVVHDPAGDRLGCIDLE